VRVKIEELAAENVKNCFQKQWKKEESDARVVGLQSTDGVQR